MDTEPAGEAGWRGSGAEGVLSRQDRERGLEICVCIAGCPVMRSAWEAPSLGHVSGDEFTVGVIQDSSCCRVSFLVTHRARPHHCLKKGTG